MGPRPGGATVVAAALVLMLALAAAALAGPTPGLEDRHPVDGHAVTTGALRIADSRGGSAILSGRALGPGGSVVGVLTVENLGATAQLELSRRHLVETLAPGGEPLATALRLRVRDLSDGGGDGLVYHGSLAAMPKLRLGLLSADESRRYRFLAFLPEPGLLDNSLMGSRIRFDYRWHLTRQ
jgi:hypothetical protein